jgi:hypothetical protein
VGLEPKGTVSERGEEKSGEERRGEEGKTRSEVRWGGEERRGGDSSGEERRRAECSSCTRALKCIQKSTGT